jgi:hypothetical protein
VKLQFFKQISIIRATISSIIAICLIIFTANASAPSEPEWAGLSNREIVRDFVVKVLTAVPSTHRGSKLVEIIESHNSAGVKFADQIESLAEHLRLHKHYGDYDALLRDLPYGAREAFRGAHAGLPSTLIATTFGDTIDADKADAVSTAIILLLDTDRFAWDI